jgi:hypothetical protein
MKYLATLAMLLAASPASATDAPIVGTYSSLAYNNAGGDLLGYEIVVTKAGHGFVAHFQIAEGAPSKPVVVPMEVLGDRFSFTVAPPHAGAGHYSGTVSSAGLLIQAGGDAMWVLSGKHPSGPFLLQRKCSYWACRGPAAK